MYVCNVFFFFRSMVVIFRSRVREHRIYLHHELVKRCGVGAT